jgi:hypothetical protein
MTSITKKIYVGFLLGGIMFLIVSYMTNTCNEVKSEYSMGMDELSCGISRLCKKIGCILSIIGIFIMTGAYLYNRK